MSLYAKSIQSKLQEAGPVLWIETEYYVDLGVDLYDTTIIHVDFCKLLEEQFEVRRNKKGTKGRFNDIAINRMVELCKEDYNQKVLPAINKFENCGEKEWSWFESLKNRFKRWIIFFLIAAVVLLVVVTAFAATAVVINTRVNTVNDTAEDAVAKIKNMKVQLNLTESINNITTGALGNLTTKIDDLIGTLDDFSTVVSEISWSGTKIYFGMMEFSQDMNVATKNLARLTQDATLADIKPETTTLHSVSKIKKGNGIQLKFTAPQRSPRSKVYRIETFDHWTNVTNSPTLLTYTGPTFLVHNSELNCSIGILPPTEPYVLETCSFKNYIDPELQKWEPVPNRLIKKTFKPVIKKTRLNTYISCPYNNITINSVTHRCPHYVFRLPVSQSFETNGTVHEVNVHYINGTNEIIPNVMNYFNRTIFDDDLQDQLAMIHQIMELNRQIGDRNRITEDRKTSQTVSLFNLFDVPTEGFWAMNALSVISTIGTIGWLISRLCFNQTGEHDTNNTTIINQTTAPENNDHYRNEALAHSPVVWPSTNRMLHHWKHEKNPQETYGNEALFPPPRPFITSKNGRNHVTYLRIPSYISNLSMPKYETIQELDVVDKIKQIEEDQEVIYDVPPSIGKLKCETIPTQV